jgi:aquaporin Z
LRHMSTSKIVTAEAVGTALLMLGGPGSAILAGEVIGIYGISMAFGFSLLIAAYIVGPISGCHINPAITLGMAITKKIEMAKVPAYIIGQLVGAVVGGGLIFAIASGKDGFDASVSGFATNGWGDRSPDGYNFAAMMVTEIVFTAVLMFVVLGTTTKSFSATQGGLVAGLTLALIHLVTIPIDNTSVNPARSIGAVVWSGNSDAWAQIWAFIVFPLVGAVIGVIIHTALDDSRLEDTMLGGTPLSTVRDKMDPLGDRLTGAADALGNKLS